MVLLKFTIKIAELCYTFQPHLIVQGKSHPPIVNKTQETTPSYHLQLQGQFFSCLRLASHLSVWMPANLSNECKKIKGKKKSEDKKPQLFIEHFMYVTGRRRWRRGCIKSHSSQRYYQVGSVVILQVKKQTEGQ